MRKNHVKTAAVFFLSRFFAAWALFSLLWLFSNRVTHRGPGTYYISHSIVISQRSFNLTEVTRRLFSVKYLFEKQKLPRIFFYLGTA